MIFESSRSFRGCSRSLTEEDRKYQMGPPNGERDVPHPFPRTLFCVTSTPHLSQMMPR